MNNGTNQEVFNLPLIKKVAIHPKNAQIFEVYVEDEGKEFVLSVSEDLLVRYHLHKGKEISKNDIANLLHQEEIQKAYNQAIQYLSYRMRSEKEVFLKLREKEFETAVIMQTIERLRNQGYLNDREFCESFIKTQINTTDKGPVVIQKELEEKGISLEIIEEFLPLFSKEKQIQKAEKLVEKLVAKKKNVSVKQLKVNAQMTLQRKGYPLDIIKIAVDSIFQEIDNDRDREAIIKQGEKALRKYGNYPEPEKQFKIKQFLYRKGFSLESIDEFLTDVEN